MDEPRQTPPTASLLVRCWLEPREDPGASEVLRDGPVSVFRVDSELDPNACGDLPDLSEAELNGESVNNEPYANQPPLGMQAS